MSGTQWMPVPHQHLKDIASKVTPLGDTMLPVDGHLAARPTRKMLLLTRQERTASE